MKFDLKMYELDGFEDNSSQSKYSHICSTIKKRRKTKWINRYAEKLTPDMILPEPLSKEEERLQMIEKSGWKNTLIDHKKLAPPQILPMKSGDEITHFNGSRCIYCYKCWGIVATGASRIECPSCSLVAHQKCGLKENKYADITQLGSLMSNQSNIHYEPKFELINTCDLPSANLKSIMETLENTDPTVLDLTSAISFDVQNGLQILQTFLFKLKPSVKTLNLTNLRFEIEWQEYLVDWVGQNEWLEVLYISTSKFSLVNKENLKKAWKKYLSSHIFEANDEIFLRIQINSSSQAIKPCPFCLSDIGSENTYNLRKNYYNTMEYKRLISAIKIQSVLRMMVFKRKYNRGRKVIIKIQRKHRASLFWKKSFAAKVLELRPFRLRLHKIWFIVSHNEKKGNSSNVICHIIYYILKIMNNYKI